LVLRLSTQILVLRFPEHCILVWRFSLLALHVGFQIMIIAQLSFHLSHFACICKMSSLNTLYVLRFQVLSAHFRLEVSKTSYSNMEVF
jgi:hypothetical protein